MKISSFTLFLLGLPAQGILAASILQSKGRVTIAELEPDQIVPEGATEVDVKLSPGSDGTVLRFKCNKYNKRIAASADGRIVGCCLPGQHLSGSKQSGFECCGQGHDLAGNAGVGYTCCPTGYMYDGSICKADPEYNSGGGQQQQLPLQQQQQQGGGSGGKCAECHQQQQNDNGAGQQQQQGDGSGGKGAGGQQQQQNGNGAGHQQQQQGDHYHPPVSVGGSNESRRPCSSGLETGKCYTFKFDNGCLLGWNGPGNYYGPGPESALQRSGLFQLCKTEECTPGLPIDPADGVRIKDLHGAAATGLNAGQWLNNFYNGGHITKTPDYASAGKFTLTRWPCGKYCLGGVDSGVGPTCPADVVGLTFTTNDKNSCVPIELMEVPCNNHANANNCIWKSGDQCCNRVDCSGSH